MFCDKDFADGANAAQSSGSAAGMIVAIATVATVVDKKHAGNSDEQLTSDTNRLPKEGLIIEIGSGRIADGRRKLA